VGVYGKVLGADYVYNKFSVSTTGARSFGELTVSGSLEASGPFGGNRLPFFDLNWLGGFTRLSGMPTNKLFGQYLALGRVGTYYRISKLPSLVGSGVYLGATVEAGNVWYDAKDFERVGLVWAGSLFGVADTILGPLYLGWGLAEQGNNSFFLSLGLPL
jgi:NTE family protein